MPKVKNKPASSQSKEKQYVDSLDFRSMWESFSMDVNKNGTKRYPTVWSYITKFTKMDWQRNLLYWILGPKVSDPPAKYAAFEQLDWETKRKEGFWYSSKNIENLRTTIASQEHGLKKLQALGTVNIGIIGRIEKLMQQIDDEFSAGITLSTLNAKENAMRAELYMNLNNQLITMMKTAQEMYSRTQGIEMQQLNTFLQMFSSGMGQAAGLGASLGLFSPPQSDDNKGIRSVSAQLIDMVTEKAVNYNMDLPSNEMTEVVRKISKPQIVRSS